MGQQVSTGLVSLNERKIVQCANSGATNTAEFNIGTVPAGKIWRIIGFNATLQIGTSATSYECVLLLNDVTFMVLRGFGLATYGQQSQVANMVFDYWACPVLTAGQVAKCPARTTTQCVSINLYYIEEDA